MTDIVLLGIFVLSISFLCSLLEAVFLSINPGFTAVAIKEDHGYAPLLERLKENVNRPIAAILTMNTIANTLGSAAIATLVFQKFAEAGASIASGVLTLLILTFGEIIPKTIGARFWKGLAPFATYAIQVLILILYPIVWLSEAVSRLAGEHDGDTVTREEMIATAEMGAEDGALNWKETVIIKNLLTLRSLYVSDIMTPRSVFFALDEEETVGEVFQKHRPLRFSRIPVYRDSLDHVVGMTMRYRVHEAVSNDLHTQKIKEITTPIQTVSEKMTVAGALDFFIRKKEHLAVAVDEYGTVTGLVTLEDAVETLLGVEIVDELDNITDMRQHALDQWQSRKNQMRRS